MEQHQSIRNPWMGIPLDLASGKAEHPVGWTDVEICLHGKTWLIHMSPQPLAFSVVLGLEFVFFSGRRDVRPGHSRQ